MNNDIVVTIKLETDEWNEFVTKLGTEFNILEHATENNYDTMNYDKFMDWMTDLHWIDKDKNIFINVEGLVSNKVVDFLNELKNFWENDAQKCIVDGKNRKCTVSIKK